MSSISEESETGDDDHLDEEFVVCERKINNNDNNSEENNSEENNKSTTTLSVENCLGDLNSFKEVSFKYFFFFIDLTHFLLISHQISSPSNHNHVSLMISVSLHFDKLGSVLYVQDSYCFFFLLHRND